MPPRPPLPPLKHSEPAAPPSEEQRTDTEQEMSAVATSREDTTRSFTEPVAAPPAEPAPTPAAAAPLPTAPPPEPSPEALPAAAVPAVAPVPDVQEQMRQLITQLPASIAEAVRPRPTEEVPKLELFKATDKDIDEILAGGEGAVAALNRIISSERMQNLKMIDAYVAEQLKPLRSTVLAVEKERVEKQFAAKYPDLADFVDVAHQEADRLAAAGVTFKSQDERFEAVAKNLRTYRDRITSKVAGATPASPRPPPADGSSRGVRRASADEPLSDEEKEMRAVAVSG